VRTAKYFNAIILLPVFFIVCHNKFLKTLYIGVILVSDIALYYPLRYLNQETTKEPFQSSSQSCCVAPFESLNGGDPHLSALLKIITRELGGLSLSLSLYCPFTALLSLYTLFLYC